MLYYFHDLVPVYFKSDWSESELVASRITTYTKTKQLVSLT